MNLHLLLVVLVLVGNCLLTQGYSNHKSSLLHIALSSRQFVDQMIEQRKMEIERNTAMRSRGGKGKIYEDLNHGYKEQENSPDCARAAITFHETTRVFLNRLGLTLKELQHTPEAVAAFNKATSDLCPLRSPCKPHSKYRTADGSCNNLFNPSWGASNTPQRRELPPVYEDGFGSPRIHGFDGKPLPSARSVSRIVHRPKHRLSTLDLDNTVMLMQWGLYLVLDILLTPMQADVNEVNCCGKDMFRSECFPIKIIQPDPYFPTSCMEFTRSLPAVDPNCFPGQREPMNSDTSYIDASQLYGSTQRRQNLLRTFHGGKLKTARTSLLPEDRNVNSCTRTDPTDYCPISGEPRVLLYPGLTSIHTVFARLHNHLAWAFSKINRHWDDERLFQEARKVVAAIHQHITFNEYLPIILGEKIMAKYGLRSRPHGFDTVYNKNVDASVSNSFNFAMRFGHSQVPDIVGSNNRKYKLEKYSYLEDNYLNPNFYLSNNGRTADGTIRWLATATGFKVDRELEFSVHDRLFLDAKGVSFDLAAYNIQRGRDNGLPPYNKWRKYCGLAPVSHWGRGPGGFTDHSEKDAFLLRISYRHPEDIDLFTGGMSEQHIPGTIVGPTFACLVAKQFKRLKTGDRFFYENPDYITGFTLPQLNEIKRIRLSRLICDYTNTDFMPHSPFKTQREHNYVKPCKAHQPFMNLEAWREAPTWYNPPLHKHI